MRRGGRRHRQHFLQRGEANADAALGQIAREVDALGGAMGQAIDATGIQFRMLNRRKGPAMHSPRAQADKKAYQHEIKRIIEEQAKLRGLPLRLPLYDLTDRANLSITDIWGNFEEAILSASSRYQTEAVLVGRVYRTSAKSWSGRWTLYTEGRQQNWQTSGDSLEVAMLPGVSQTAEILAQRYAQVDSALSSDQLRVHIKGVSALAAYMRVVKYLDSLDAITQVQPSSIDSDSVIFTLTSRRGQSAVSQAIGLGHTLVEEPSLPVSTPGSGTGGKEPVNIPPRADLVYRLVP